MTQVAEVRRPVHVDGEVVATKRVGAYRHLTLTAPGVPEHFRAGNFVAVSVEGHVARRPLWVHRVRASSAGLVYAPNAGISFTGGSTFYGSVVGGIIKDMGGATINYDRRLDKTALMQGPPVLSAFTWKSF